jgi:hypothetical protein
LAAFRTFPSRGAIPGNPNTVLIGRIPPFCQFRHAWQLCEDDC